MKPHTFSVIDTSGHVHTLRMDHYDPRAVAAVQQHRPLPFGSTVRVMAPDRHTVVHYPVSTVKTPVLPLRSHVAALPPVRRAPPGPAPASPAYHHVTLWPWILAAVFVVAWLIYGVRKFRSGGSL